MNRVHVIGHVEFEGLGYIADWLAERGWPVRWTRVWETRAGDLPRFPSPSDYDWLIVMGGPMSVYDRDPWIAAEKEAILAAIEAGKTVIGVCLGSQFIAAVLGAKVYPHVRKEIGWFPVLPVLAQPANPSIPGLAEIFKTDFTALHWHGDTFDLPPGAVHLGRSAVCENQAFVAAGGFGLPPGSTAIALGLQFHLEMTANSVAAILANEGESLAALRAEDRPLAHEVMDAAEIAAGVQQYVAETNRRMAAILTALDR